MNKYFLLMMMGGIFILSGCKTMDPIQTVEYVDINRFMGDWYVIAAIPVFIEAEAYNGVESYELKEDGSIATTYRFNKGSYNGPVKVYHPRGFIRDHESNAVWGMQFVWPFKSEYRIVYLDEGYTQTVIGRSKRDYVWIMARESSIPDHDYQEIVNVLKGEGYDTRKLRKVPHQQQTQ